MRPTEKRRVVSNAEKRYRFIMGMRNGVRQLQVWVCVGDA